MKSKMPLSAGYVESVYMSAMRSVSMCATSVGDAELGVVGG